MPQTSLSAFDAAAVLILIAAILGYINLRWFRLPSAVGLTVMGAVASLVVVAIGALFPAMGLAGLVEQFLSGIDFHRTLMDGMLSFLLFAGALHVDWHAMRRGRWAIILLSTLGVVLSTLLVGGGFWLLAGWFGAPVPLIWSMVFGALISPTDPVAVMAIMKRAAVPAELRAMVAGESLYNDGIGVVIFGILLTAALGSAPFTLQSAATQFVQQAVGGGLFGGAVGYVALLAMRSIDEYNVEVMITLAVVMAGYSLAHVLGVSGPVAMAVAGMLIGNKGLGAGVGNVMSTQTEDYLVKFWELIDEILNAVLFLLIGLQVIVVVAQPRLLLVGVVAVPLVLGARVLSVLGPLALVRKTVLLGRLTVPTLVWGGLRGGISIALALSLPNGRTRGVILAATFVIVLFSVIVQGGTIGGLIARLTARPAGEDAA